MGKLRVYLDAIAEVEAMTDIQWINDWARHCSGRYMPRVDWLAYLQRCALKEAQKLIELDVA